MSVVAPARNASPSDVGGEKPYGFRVTIERRNRAGKMETHIFPSKTGMISIAQKAAHYKLGFLRLLQVEALDQDQWTAIFGDRSKGRA
jgi:hypothetical protein